MWGNFQVSFLYHDASYFESSYKELWEWISVSSREEVQPEDSNIIWQSFPSEKLVLHSEAVYTHYDVATSHLGR